MSEPVDSRTAGYFLSLAQTLFRSKSWKEGMDSLVETLREKFVFDNLAVYLRGETEETMEVAYARAMGREQRAEADAAWGEILAGQVMAQRVSRLLFGNSHSRRLKNHRSSSKRKGILARKPYSLTCSETETELQLSSS